MKKTKKAYKEHLNEVMQFSIGSDNWILGGKYRKHYAYAGKYGSAMRKYDPVQFEVGYNDWVRETK